MGRKVEPEKQHTEKYYVRLTKQQAKWLEEIRERKGATSMAEVLRMAAAEYIDAQGGNISSRRHFSRSLRQYIRQLEEQAQIMNALLLTLLAQQLASEEEGEEITAEELLADAARGTMPLFFKLQATWNSLAQSKRKAEEAAAKEVQNQKE